MRPLARLLARLLVPLPLAGCASAPSSTPPAPGASASSAAPQARAADAVFADWDRGDAPGASVAVVKDGAVVYARSFGLARLDPREPATPRTDYRLASVTKQFTAMATLMMVREGKVRLDQTLTELFPGFPAYGRGITVRQLLTHTSGLPDYEDLMPAGDTAQIHDAGVLALLERTDSTYFPPGTRFRYSNSGYALLSLVVERASGMPFARFLATRIFGPLGMTGTVAYERGVSEVTNRAYGYTPRAGGYALTDQSTTSAVLGDGGIYSSVTDLAKWDAALYTERLVDSATFRLAVTPLRVAGVDGHAVDSDYGFGWYVDSFRGHTRYRHEGETRGFRNAIQRFPAEHLAVIVLCNRADADAKERAERVAALWLGEAP